MTANPIETVDTSWKGLYKWGGISAFLVGVLYFIALVLGIAMLELGLSFTGGEAILKFFSGQTTLAYSFYGVSILADIMFVPVAIALYFALKGINKNAMITATSFGGLYVALDLGVTLIACVALITLSQNYAAATSDVQRAAYVAVAQYAMELTAVGVTIYSTATLTFWSLVTSLVMLKGVFNRATAYLGIAGSIFGAGYVLSLILPALATISLVVFSVLFGVWYILVGYKLYRLGKQ